MKIIAVDDERIALENLVDVVTKVATTMEGDDSSLEVNGFQHALEALEFARTNDVDVAFLDIEMGEVNGIELAKQLKLINPLVNIIFTTGYSQYGMEAFNLHASGYVMKPIMPEKVKVELEGLRNPVPYIQGQKLTVRTFGNFEVFFNDVPLKFKYSKSKELLAYLIDRNGTLCTNNEIMYTLWEDENHKSYLRNAKADLLNTLKEVGCEDILAKQRARIGIIPSKVECDYFDWIMGKITAINAYQGEYMTQYSWGELTHGILEEGKK